MKIMVPKKKLQVNFPFSSSSEQCMKIYHIDGMGTGGGVLTCCTIISVRFNLVKSA